MLQTNPEIQPSTEASQAPQVQEQGAAGAQQPKRNHRLLLISVIAIVLIVSLSFYFSANPAGGQKNLSTSSISNTTAAPIPAFNVSTIANKSNALFGIPNQKSFVLSSSFHPSFGQPSSDYWPSGAVIFFSNAYGLNFTAPVINYSSGVPITYNLSIPVSYASDNYPIAVLVYLWKFNDAKNVTSDYLGALQAAYNTKTAYNSTKLPGSTNSSINLYYIVNGTLVNVTGTNSSSMQAYSKSLNTSMTHAFISNMAPVYTHLIQDQMTFGYKNYVVTVYSFGVLGIYNENYTRAIALHLLGILEAH